MDSAFIGYPLDLLWLGSFPMGPNYAYADANGDGIVNILDLQQSIVSNFGLTHDDLTPDVFVRGAPGEVPPLTLHSQTQIVNGDQEVNFDIDLGDATFPVDSFYGLSFQLFYDTAMVKTGLSLDLQDNSWIAQGLGNEQIRLLVVDHPDHGYAQVALTRINQQTSSGFGKILKGIIVVEDIIFRPAQDTFRVSVDSVKLITSTLSDIPTAPKGLAIPSVVTSIEEPFLNSSFRVYPNPGSSILNIDFEDKKSGIKQIKLINLLGELVHYVTIEGSPASYRLNIEHIPPNIYFLVAETEKRNYTTKVFIH